MSQKNIYVIVIVVLIASISALVYKYRCNIFKCTVDKPQGSVPQGSLTTEWIPEMFPLNIGMYGPKIKELQKALKINVDGEFGTGTQTAVINKGYNLPITEDSYNEITSTGENNPDIGKLAKAKNPFTLLYFLNGNISTSKDKDESIGYIKSISGNYYLLDGDIYKVKKSTVYLV